MLLERLHNCDDLVEALIGMILGLGVCENHDGTVGSSTTTHMLLHENTLECKRNTR